MSKKVWLVAAVALAGVIAARKLADDRAEADLWHDATDDLGTE